MNRRKWKRGKGGREEGKKEEINEYPNQVFLPSSRPCQRLPIANLHPGGREPITAATLAASEPQQGGTQRGILEGQKTAQVAAIPDRVVWETLLTKRSLRQKSEMSLPTLATETLSPLPA